MANYEPPTDDNGHPKKRKRRKKDPAAPKKNCSAFLFFSQVSLSETALSICIKFRVLFFTKEMRPRIKQSQPELTTTQISEVLGRQWKTMMGENRAVSVTLASSTLSLSSIVCVCEQRFDHLAREDKMRYERQMEQWHATKHLRTPAPQTPLMTHMNEHMLIPSQFPDMSDSPLHLDDTFNKL